MIGSPTYKFPKYVEKMLFFGRLYTSVIKDSSDIVTIITNENIELGDILIIFYVITLFTKTPLNAVV